MYFISYQTHYESFSYFSTNPTTISRRSERTWQLPGTQSSSRVDFCGLISKQFCAEPEEFEEELDECNLINSGFQSDSFDESIEERLKPGVRDKQTAASLRIHNIEKKLFTSKDLSKKQRRALQARKNTAIFRERKRQVLAYKQLFEVELDKVITNVSFSPFFFGSLLF